MAKQKERFKLTSEKYQRLKRSTRTGESVRIDKKMAQALGAYFASLPQSERQTVEGRGYLNEESLGAADYTRPQTMAIVNAARRAAALRMENVAEDARTDIKSDEAASAFDVPKVQKPVSTADIRAYLKDRKVSGLEMQRAAPSVPSPVPTKFVGTPTHGRPNVQPRVLPADANIRMAMPTRPLSPAERDRYRAEYARRMEEKYGIKEALIAFTPEGQPFYTNVRTERELMVESLKTAPWYERKWSLGWYDLTRGLGAIGDFVGAFSIAIKEQIGQETPHGKNMQISALGQMVLNFTMAGVSAISYASSVVFNGGDSIQKARIDYLRERAQLHKDLGNKAMSGVYTWLADNAENAISKNEANMRKYWQGVQMSWNSIEGSTDIYGQLYEDFKKKYPNKSRLTQEYVDFQDEYFRKQQEAAKAEEQKNLNYADKEYQSALRRASEAGFESTQEAFGSGLFDTTIKFRTEAVRNRVLSMNGSVYNSYTWASEPEKYEQFLRGVAVVELQLGRELLPEEVRRLKNNYMNMWTEAAGEFLYDPINLVPAVAMEKMVSGVKIAGGSTAKVIRTTFPPLDRAITFLSQKTSYAVANKMGRTIYDTLAKISRAYQNTSDLAEVVKVVGEQGDTIRSADDLLKLAKQPGMEGLNNITFDEFKAWHQAGAASLIPGEKWAEGMTRAMDNAEQVFINTAYKRLIKKGVAPANALPIAQKAAADAMKDAKYAPRYLNDFATMFSNAYLDTRRITRTSSLLEDTMSGWVAKQAYKLSTDKTAGEAMQTIGKLGYKGIEYAVQVGTFARNVWTMFVLNLNPGRIIRNVIDSMFRDVVYGGNVFDDLDTLFRSTQYEFADAVGFIPIEFGQSLARSGLEFTESVPSRLLYEDWKPLPGPAGILSYWNYEYTRLKGVGKSPAVADAVLGAMPAGSRTIMHKMWDGLKTGVTNSSLGVRAISGALADYNTAIEFTLRLRMFHREYFKVLKTIEPIFKARGLDSLGPEARDIAERVWAMAGSNPAQIKAYLDNLVGDVATSRPEWDFLLPSNFGDSLPMEASEKASFIYSIKTSVGKFIRETRASLGREPTAAEFATHMEDIRTAVRNEIQLKMSELVDRKMVSGQLGTDLAMSADVGVDDLSGSAPVLTETQRANRAALDAEYEQIRVKLESGTLSGDELNAARARMGEIDRILRPSAIAEARAETLRIFKDRPGLVVDETVYRGRSLTGAANDPGDLGIGVYHSSSEDVASSYGFVSEEPVKLRNALELNTDEAADLAERYKTLSGTDEERKMAAERLTQDLQDAGYDGLKVHNWDGPPGTYTIVTFPPPKQVATITPASTAAAVPTPKIALGRSIPKQKSSDVVARFTEIMGDNDIEVISIPGKKSHVIEENGMIRIELGDDLSKMRPGDTYDRLHSLTVDLFVKRNQSRAIDFGMKSADELKKNLIDFMSNPVSMRTANMDMFEVMGNLINNNENLWDLLAKTGKDVKVTEFNKAWADFEKYGYTTLDMDNVEGFREWLKTDEQVIFGHSDLLHLNGFKAGRQNRIIYDNTIKAVSELDRSLGDATRLYMDDWSKAQNRFESYTRLVYPGPHSIFAPRDRAEIRKLWDMRDEVLANMYDVERQHKVDLDDMLMNNPVAAQDYLLTMNEPRLVYEEFLKRNGFDLKWDDAREVLLPGTTVTAGGTTRTLSPFERSDIKRFFFTDKPTQQVSGLFHVDPTSRESTVDQLRHAIQRTFGTKPGASRTIAETIDNQARWWVTMTGQPMTEYYKRLGFGNIITRFTDIDAELARKGVIEVTREGSVYFLGTRTGELTDIIASASKWFYSDMTSAAKFNSKVAKDVETINKFLEKATGIPIVNGELDARHVQAFSDSFVKFIREGTPFKSMVQRTVDEAAMDAIVVKSAALGKKTDKYTYFKFDKNTNTMLYDREFVESLFYNQKKPWTNMRDGVNFPEDAFSTPAEWADFVLRKEKARIIYKRMKGESLTEYAKRLNDISQKKLTSFTEIIPGDMRKPFAGFSGMLSRAYDGLAGSKAASELPDDVMSILQKMSIEHKMRSPRQSSRLTKVMVQQSGLQLSDDEILRLANGTIAPVPVTATKMDIAKLRNDIFAAENANLDIITKANERIRITGKVRHGDTVAATKLNGEQIQLTWQEVFDSKIVDPTSGTVIHEPLPPSSSAITREAEQLLDYVNSGKRVGKMNDDLTRIATENGITVTEGMKSEEVIDALKAKAEAVKPKYASVDEIPADEVLKVISARAKQLGVSYRAPEIKVEIDRAWELLKEVDRRFANYPEAALQSVDSFKKYLRDRIDQGWDEISKQFSRTLHDVEQFEQRMMDFHLPRMNKKMQEQIFEFRGWFKDAYFKDPSGHPMTFFHGTQTDQALSATPPVNVNDKGIFGQGIHLTIEPDEASLYASTAEGANVRKVVVNVKKPYIVKDGYQRVVELNTESLRALGYDSVVVTEGDVIAELVVFDSASVRPAWNTPPMFTDADLYGDVIAPRISQFEMDDGVRMWVEANIRLTDTFTSGLDELNRLEDFLKSGKYQTTAVTEQAATELKAWREIAMQSKAEMVATAMNGGKVGKQTFEGAVNEVNRVMIDYNSQSRFDQIMKNVYPFWIFPSRSWPFWAEALATHPQIIAGYQKVRRFSEMARYQAGAVTSQGRPMQSLEGYIPIPGTDLWFNPLAPFSFAYVLGMNMSKDDLLYRAQEDNDMPPHAFLAKQFLEIGPVYGFSPAPWVTWLVKNQMNIPDSIMSPWPLTPQISLMPRWWVYDMAHKSGRIGDWTQAIYPEAPWHDQLVERYILERTWQNIQGMSKEEAFKVYQQAATAIKIKGSNDLWKQSYKEYTNSEAGRAWSSFVLGYYVKSFSDAQADLLALRNQRNQLKSSMNNLFQADLFDLPLDYEERWDRYISMSDVPEGWVYELYSDIGWVRNEEGKLVREPAERAKYLAMAIEDGETQRLYYQKSAELRKTYDAKLAALPIGAEYAQRQAIYDWYSREQATLARLNTYVSKHGTYMPIEMIQQNFTDKWFFHVQSFKPRWIPEQGQTYDEFKQRLAEWENDLPSLAQGMMASFLERDDVLQTYSHLHKDQQLPKDFFATLKNETSVDNLLQWNRSRDSAIDALNEAWKVTYWEVYWDAVGEKSGYDRQGAEMDFAAEHPEPTADDLFKWIDENYGGRFTREEIVALVDPEGSDVYSIDERILSQHGEEYIMRGDIWDLLGFIGPGKNSELIQERLSSVDKAVLSDWYDSGGSLWKGDMETLGAFKGTLEKVVSELGLKPPTRAEVAQYAIAQNQNKALHDHMAREFATDWDVLSDVLTDYYGRNTKEKKAFAKEFPDQLEFVKYYENYRKNVFAKENPEWASYYLWAPKPAVTVSAEELSAILPPPETSLGLQESGVPTNLQKKRGTSFTAPTTQAPVNRTVKPPLIPTIPPSMMTSLNEGMRWEISKHFETGRAMSNALIKYLNGLKARHPEWAEWIEYLKKFNP